MHQRAQRDRPPRAHDRGKRHGAHRLGRGIDDDHIVELLRQILGCAHEVDHLPNGPEGRRLDHLALHQPSGAFLGIGQRLCDGGTFGRLERIQHLALFAFAQILDQIDHIVGLELAHRLGQLGRGEDFQQLVTHPFLDFRQDGIVELGPDQIDHPAPVLGRNLFQQIGRVGCVQIADQREHRHPVADAR